MSSSPVRSPLALGVPLPRFAFLAQWMALVVLELVSRVLFGRLFLGTFPPAHSLQPFWFPRSGASLGPLDPGLLVALAFVVVPLAGALVLIAARRARDAGLSPWLGLGVLIPYFGLLVLIVLVVLPSRRLPANDAPEQLRARSAADEVRTRALATSLGVLLLAAVALGLVFGMTALGEAYGTALFASLPLLFGALVGFLHNVGRRRGLGETIGLTILLASLGLFSLVVVAIEGIVCVAMAYPIVVPMAVAGSMIGRVMAQQAFVPNRSFGLLVCALPLAGWMQARLEPPAAREVATSIEVDAPPSVVWQHVVRFAELPEPEGFLFDTGIAYPVRAHLEGEGVGAVRHCEFTTGAFVEPITVWDPPRRLAFDVAAQPHPMEEWSFYAAVEPPHLERSFRSVRGEFRLIELPGGRTRLEGSTWYTLDIGPVVYWQLWTDRILHRIHLRVLEHVKQLAEAEA